MLGDYVNLAAARVSQDVACADLASAWKQVGGTLEGALQHCTKPHRRKSDPKLWSKIYQEVKAQHAASGRKGHPSMALVRKSYKEQGGKDVEIAKSANVIEGCQGQVRAHEAMLRILCEGKSDLEKETAIQAWKEAIKTHGAARKAEKSSSLSYILGGLAIAGLVGVGLVLLKRRTRAAR